MGWPKDPFVTDTAYKTPLPCQPCERHVWRLVARLYEYDTLAALMKLNDAATPTVPPQSPPLAASSSKETLEALHGTSPTTEAAANVSPSSPTRSPRSATLRAEAMERRSAFLAAATAVNVHPTDNAPLTTVQRSTSETLGTSNTTTTTAAAAAGAPAGVARPTTPSITAVPPTAPTSQPMSPFPVRGSSGSWSNNNSLSGTTGYIRATSLRALEPLRALLADFAEKRRVMGAGVVDVAVQHPLPCLRLELLRMLLAYPLWEWSMCAPVAVAAGLGDIDAVQLLLEVPDLDPNTGFPLTVAVRHRQEEAVLPFLLSHHRIRCNYGGAFYVAVVMGNVPAMHLLGDAAGVNVNRFANNEGTSALLYALRQFLLCRRAEVQQAQLSPPSSTPVLHAAKPPQSVSSPTRLTPEEMAEEGEEEITATPLLAVHADGRRDNPLFGSGSLEGRREEGVEGDEGEDGDNDNSSSGGGGAWRAARALDRRASSTLPRGSLRLAGDDTHSAAFRRDTADRPLQTTRHWLEVLLYLLDHPAIEINAGFYMTPLQICVLAGSAEVVGWLLQHPHLRPGRLPKATTVLCNSYYLLQHHALSPSAMQCVVATPIEMAARLRHLDIFRQLARDQRVHVPARLTMDLERSATDGDSIPYLTALAQQREEWEGWGWRWRRRCTSVAAGATTLFAVCFWVMALLWPTTLRGGLLVLTVTYVVGVVVSLALFLWQAEGLRHTPTTSLTHGATVVVALLRHLCPGWSTLRLRVAVVALLACPGLLPVLDVLCAWCIYRVHSSRQAMQTADEANADMSPHSVTPTGAAQARSSRHHDEIAHPSHHHHHPHGYLHQQQRQDLERLSSTASWGWSVGLSNASDVSGNSSFSDAWLGGRNGSGSANDSFSRPRPAVARSRRQSAAAAPASVPLPLREGDNNNGATAATAAAAATASRRSSHGAFTQSPSIATGGGGGPASSMASPSMCTSRNRSPWVVPGRASRYASRTEFHAPDLLLRALAYASYDSVLALPRLLTCVVGIFMFMYMVFPTAAPSHASSTLSGPALAEAVRGHSSFTLYYGVRKPSITLVQPAVYNITDALAMPSAAVAAAAAVRAVGSAASSESDLPEYSVAIGLVGLVGLMSSVFGGAALLAMLGSLRTVTVQAFFANLGDQKEVKGNAARVESRTGENRSWHENHQRVREAQPNYAL